MLRSIQFTHPTHPGTAATDRLCFRLGTSEAATLNRNVRNSGGPLRVCCSAMTETSADLRMPKIMCAHKSALPSSPTIAAPSIIIGLVADTLSCTRGVDTDLHISNSNSELDPLCVSLIWLVLQSCSCPTDDSTENSSFFRLSSTLSPSDLNLSMVLFRQSVSAPIEQERTIVHFDHDGTRGSNCRRLLLNTLIAFSHFPLNADSSPFFDSWPILLSQSFHSGL